MDRTDLPVEAVSVDGLYIEDAIQGYMTISTSGRESLARELETLTVGSSNGETIKRTRYPSRTIEVEFLIKGNSAEDIAGKMNHLSNLLSNEEADWVFNNEPDKFFTGTAIMADEVEKGGWFARGKYNIYCAYPFKRSCAVFEVSPTTVNNTDAEFVFNYGGNYPAKPVLRAEFAGALSGGDYSEDGDCGFVAFMDSDENIIQLGNPDAIDVDAYAKAGTLLNREFTTASGFTTTGGKTYGNKAVTGSVSANQGITDSNWNKGKGQTLKFAKPSYGTGTAWHGPILFQNTSGAVNFELSLVHRICASDVKQLGTFECGVYNTTSNVMIAGFIIEKDASGTNGRVRYIVNGQTAKTETIDLSYNNTHFGYCKKTAIYKTQYYNKKKKKWQTSKIKGAKTRKVVDGYNYTQSNLNSKIVKNGTTVIFSIGNLAKQTFTNTDITETPSHRVSLHFGQYKTNAVLHTNAVNSVKFVNNPSTKFADIPNVFTSGDVVEADCNDASIYIMRSGTVEGALSPQYGALGNNWEDFALEKGQNTIKAVWSDWVNVNYKPALKILYNEVYL